MIPRQVRTVRIPVYPLICVIKPLIMLPIISQTANQAVFPSAEYPFLLIIKGNALYMIWHINPVRLIYAGLGIYSFITIHMKTIVSKHGSKTMLFITVYQIYIVLSGMIIRKRRLCRRYNRFAAFIFIHVPDILMIIHMRPIQS